MPEWTKVSQTSFSVRDAESSASWSQRVLGLEEINRAEGDSWCGILLIHPASANLLEYTAARCSPDRALRPPNDGPQSRRVPGAQPRGAR
jgi:catechol 2,3-dioxygenase-like lactoylglutathione lyase family enzyme